MYVSGNIKTTVRSIFELITAVVVLINSGYYRATVTDSYIPLIFLICVSMLWLLFEKNAVNKISIGILLSLLLGIAFCILANFNASNILSGGRVAVTIICSFIVVRSISVIDFSKYFVALIKIIIVLSILLSILIRLEISSFSTISKYYDLLIVTSRGGDRAYGIFWEPGVFASMIIISMLMEYFVSRRPVRLFGLALYIVGVFITKSTAGIMLLIIVSIGLVWEKIERKKKSIAYSFLFIILMACVALFYEQIILFLVDLNPELFGKLVEVGSDTTSTRLNGPLVNLQIFFEKPWFGWGFTDAASEFAARMGEGEFGKIVAQTSTSTQIMASIGILGVVYSLAFVSPVFTRKKLTHISSTVKLVLGFCMLLIVNKEPHIYIATSWVILFYLNVNNSDSIQSLKEK